MPSFRPRWFRLLALALALLWLPVQSGCAPYGKNPALNLPPYDLHVRLQQQKIAILVHSGDKPKTLDLPVESRTGGALYGAGEGFFTVLGGFSGGSCEGAGCGVVALVVLGIAVVGGVVGAVAGAVGAPSKKQSRQMEASLAAALNTAAHGDLAQKVREEALLNKKIDLNIVTATDPEYESHSGYPAIRQLGYDSVLDLLVKKVEFEGGKGKNPGLTLRLEVEAHLVELDRPDTPYRRTFFYTSRPAPFSWWVSGDGSNTRRMFEVGIALLSRQIYQGVFVRFGPVRK